ncbi:MAG: 2-phosphosulfolactate phosphatase [Clostridia bacterium]|nr:2-phosphosulfolactate phosphatase [Clostridia bacterium]
MKLDVVLRAEDVSPENLKGKTAVAIDAFRATTTVITALEKGCRAVIPVLSVEEAEKKREELSALGDEVLIAGERKGLKIPGFDLGNSPREFKEVFLKNKIIILTTSNGTRAIHGSEGAERILIGAFINCRAVAEVLASKGEDVVFVCAGRLGEFSLEDFLAAGAVTHYLKKRAERSLEISDLLIAAEKLFQCTKEDLPGFLGTGKHGKYLREIGFPQDIDHCCALNTSDIVPEYINGVVKI